MNTNKSESSIISKILRNSVLILLLIIFISIVYNFRNRQEKTAVALMSDAVASKELSGVFIRDEEVRLYSGNGIISYNVADGGKLGNGTVIAEIYPDDKQIARNREIERLTKELEKAQKQVEGQERKLSNENFVSRAPEQVVATVWSSI